MPINTNNPLFTRTENRDTFVTTNETERSIYEKISILPCNHWYTTWLIGVYNVIDLGGKINLWLTERRNL